MAIHGHASLVEEAYLATNDTDPFHKWFQAILCHFVGPRMAPAPTINVWFPEPGLQARMDECLFCLAGK